MEDEKKYVHTIEISRPTGPRIIPPLAGESRGYLTVYAPKVIGGIKSGALAVSSVLRRPRVIAAGSTLALALITHLAVASMTQGFSSLMTQASILLTGAGVNPTVAASSYTGPGDTFSTSVIAAYSCAQAYNAAYATALGNACDLVDSAAPTTVICTLKFLATGKVDLATASCTGAVAPAAKCAAATGGKCNISKVYDQSGNGRDVVQVTAANQPTLLFSSTPTGTLPAIDCGTAASNLSLTTAGTITQAQPFTMFAVMIRSSDFTTGAGAMGGPAASNVQGLSSGTLANTVSMQTNFATNNTASDSAWHAVGGVANGASGAVNVDGTDSTGQNTGTNAFSAVGLRLCRGNGAQYPGKIAEAIMYGAAANATDRGNLSTNAHSSGRYNF